MDANQGRIVLRRKPPQARHVRERTNAAGKPIRNKILLAMSDVEFRAIRPYLKYLTLPSHLRLHEPHQPLKFVYFPNEGLISLVVVMANGKTVEAGIVGSEGIAGLPGIVGLSRAPIREVMQIGGNGFRVKIRDMKKMLESAASLQKIVEHYTMMLGLQVAQTAACNRLHDIDRRLARWLLMAHDRVDSGTLRITHDFLATMLGTDRPSVSKAAGLFQRMNIIKYSRGAVKILNRSALEDQACECYAVIQLYAHMSHPAPDKTP
ncbi:MAG: Crp/Fnr family transcriptional regulator [Candidatus Acidiferrum sp.]